MAAAAKDGPSSAAAAAPSAPASATPPGPAPLDSPEVRRLTLQLLGTYLSPASAHDWLQHAIACYERATAAAASQAPAPKPPAAVHTDTTPVQAFVHECQRQPYDAALPGEDHPDVLRAALQWFVRALLLITSAQPRPLLVALTLAQRQQMTTRNDVDAYSARESDARTPLRTGAGGAIDAVAWSDGGALRAVDCLHLNGFNLHPDAMRPFGPDESHTPWADIDGLNSPLMHSPLALACHWRPAMAHALLDLPTDCNSDLQLLTGGTAHALNADFVSRGNLTVLYHAVLRPFGRPPDVHLIARLLPRMHARTRKRAPHFPGGRANGVLQGLLYAVRCGIDDAHAGDDDTNDDGSGGDDAAGTTVRRRVAIVRLLCSAEGGAPDDNSGIDLDAADNEGRTMDQVLALPPDTSGALTPHEPHAVARHALLWATACEHVRSARARVRAYPARFRAALSDALPVPPVVLHALVANYVLWPLSPAPVPVQPAAAADAGAG